MKTTDHDNLCTHCAQPDDIDNDEGLCQPCEVLNLAGVLYQTPLKHRAEMLRYIADSHVGDVITLENMHNSRTYKAAQASGATHPETTNPFFRPAAARTVVELRVIARDGCVTGAHRMNRAQLLGAMSTWSPLDVWAASNDGPELHPYAYPEEGVCDLREIPAMIARANPHLTSKQLSYLLGEPATQWTRYVHGRGNPGAAKMHGWLLALAAHGLAGQLIWVPTPGGGCISTPDDV